MNVINASVNQQNYQNNHNHQNENQRLLDNSVSRNSNETSQRSDGYQKKNTQKYRDRGELMKALKFPENSANLVVIPSNEKGTGFLRTCYDPEVLDGTMSKDEFMKVIDQASKEVAKVYSKKRLADTADIDSYKMWFSFLSFIMALLFLGMIYVGIDYEIFYLQLAAYCIMAFAMIIIVTLSLYECFRDSTKKFINFNQSVKQSLDTYFGEVNLQMQAIGIEWSVEEGHYWIECKIIKDFDRMRTTPTQNYFTQENLITDNGRSDMNQIQDARNLQLGLKPYSRGSEPEKEDQLIPGIHSKKVDQDQFITAGEGKRITLANQPQKRSRELPSEKIKQKQNNWGADDIHY